MGAKRLITVHSQKGGVGKTTIALYFARRFAEPEDRLRPGRNEKTVLIDADLTGTSLADVLELEAPYTDAKTYASTKKTREKMKEWARLWSEQADDTRGERATRNVNFHEWPDPKSQGLRLLNDMLFCNPWKFAQSYRKGDSRAGHDLNVRQVLWRWKPSGASSELQQEFKNLRVVPSSAIPSHVAGCLPHIYKEDVTQYLANRLKELVWQLWHMPKPFETVIIDTPPAIQGMSKAAFRLHEDLKKMSESQPDDKKVSVWSRALFVASPDEQDSIALGHAVNALLNESSLGKQRTLSTMPSSPGWVRFIVNRLVREVDGKHVKTHSNRNFEMPEEILDHYHALLGQGYRFDLQHSETASKELQFDEARNGVFVLEYSPNLAVRFLDLKLTFGLHDKMERLLEWIQMV